MRVRLPPGAKVPAALRFQRWQFHLERNYRGRTVNASALDKKDGGGGSNWLDNQADPLSFESSQDEDAKQTPVRQMPRSLLRDDGGELLPDWGKILSGVAKRQTRGMVERSFVAERRWREGATRQNLFDEVLAGMGCENPRRTAARVREIGAAWRWLDRPDTIRGIDRVIRQAKHAEDLAAASKVLSAEPTSKSAVDALMALKEKRKQMAKRDRCL